MAYHPHPRNTTVLETQCGSYWSVVFTFECLNPTARAALAALASGAPLADD